MKQLRTMHTLAGGVVLASVILSCYSRTIAGELTVRLENATGVTFVGAINRWDADGNPRVPVNPKAKIDQPRVDAQGQDAGNGRWVFKNLPSGRYDLVILAENRIRIEGFHYPPILEFDPFWLHDKKPSKTDISRIIKHISQSKHYENKVTPMYFAGGEKYVRVFVQLLRDKPTSFDAKFGEQVATLRHEVWQYTNQFGGWAKEKRTRVFHRILMAKRELRQWTWVWEEKLGGIEVSNKPALFTCKLPSRLSKEVRGLLP